MTDWPFQDPPNVAVIANKRIVYQGEWIAYVSHDADDGAWQFHTNVATPPQQEEAAVVSLHSIVQLDQSIKDLANLPSGWHAWRESRDAPWRRSQTV